MIEQAAFQGRVCIATCDTVLMYQGVNGAAKPLDETYRAELEKFRTATS